MRAKHQGGVSSFLKTLPCFFVQGFQDHLKLVLSAKSKVTELLEDAKAEARSKNAWRKIARASALIDEGDQLFAEAYRSALPHLSRQGG